MAFHALGAVGVIAVNPGKYAHWGGGSATWGTADLDDLPHKPAIPAVAVNRAVRRCADRAGRAGRSRPAWSPPSRRAGSAACCRWWKSAAAASPSASCCCTGTTTPGTSASATMPPATPAMLEIARVLWQHRDRLERSVRICWWPGHSTGRFAGSTWYADEFALDLAPHCLAHTQLRQPRLPRRHRLSSHPVDGVNCGFVTRCGARRRREGGGRQAAAQSSDFSFNNLGITGFFSYVVAHPEEGDRAARLLLRHGQWREISSGTPTTT